MFAKVKRKRSGLSRSKQTIHYEFVGSYARGSSFALQERVYYYFIIILHCSSCKTRMQVQYKYDYKKTQQTALKYLHDPLIQKPLKSLLFAIVLRDQWRGDKLPSYCRVQKRYEIIYDRRVLSRPPAKNCCIVTFYSIIVYTSFFFVEYWTKLVLNKSGKAGHTKMFSLMKVRQ